MLLAVINTNDIRDIKPPVQIPSGWAWLWWAVAILALAFAAAMIWRWWRSMPVAEEPEPAVPPHERALQKLYQALTLMKQPRPFTFHVSDTIRVYLEERFDFHAPERTTEEFLVEMQSSLLLTADQKESLADFLQRADLVKFARYEPGPLELRELYEAAVRLVEETKSEPPPPQPQTGIVSEPRAIQSSTQA